jgi:hypothetical protein
LFLREKSFLLEKSFLRERLAFMTVALQVRVSWSLMVGSLIADCLGPGSQPTGYSPDTSGSRIPATSPGPGVIIIA